MGAPLLNNRLSVIVLAAGKGSRMHSARPKVLQPLAGLPLLQHVIQAVDKLSPRQLLIVHARDQRTRYEPLIAALSPQPAYPIDWVLQEQQWGTGHAVSLAIEHLLSDTDYVLVLYGDMPLVTHFTLQKMLAPLSPKTLSLLTGTPPDLNGLGRILRNPASGKIEGIVEQKDALPEQLSITEINAGVYGLPAAFLKKAIPAITNDNRQQEYYLTDVIQYALSHNMHIETINPVFPWEIQGINTFQQLAQLERLYQRHLAETWMARGVHIVDPNRFDMRGNTDLIHIAPDVTIDVNVILEGNVNIASGVTIGPNVYIKNSTIGSGTSLLANSHIDGATIEEEARVGPFARLRPGTALGAHSGIGNFVEVKQSRVGPYSKINHLSYVGDATVGNHVNIGAGTITCNYDGANKHPTVIADQVAIGAGVQLVAPLVVGEGATVGAGTIVTKDVPAAALLYNRFEPCLRSNWQRPKKAEKHGKEED